MPEDKQSEFLSRGKESLASPVPDFKLLSKSQYYALYGDRTKQYGETKLLEVILDVCKKFYEKTMEKIHVGNLSYQHGGTMPPHKEHKYGLDADLDCVVCGNVGDANYNEAKWEEFLTICAQDDRIKKIYFEHAGLVARVNQKVKKEKLVCISGHKSHCHISLD